MTFSEAGKTLKRSNVFIATPDPWHTPEPDNLSNRLIFYLYLSRIRSLIGSWLNTTGNIQAGLNSEARQEAVIDIILAEAIKTSEIEGEYPNRKDVLSSIRKNLGLHHSSGLIKDKSAAGLGELMIDIRSTFKEPLTEEKLFAWHKMLPGEHTGSQCR